MISVTDLRNGTKVEMDAGLWECLDYQHQKIGRGGAKVVAKFRNLETGSIVERTFNAGEKLQDIFIDYRTLQYLFTDGDLYTFMDLETFEQPTLSRTQIGDAAERARALAPDTPLELILTRPPGRDAPSGTAPWLDAIRPAPHHHLRLGEASEARRAARRLTGRARILVLSGGGARGYVHIGLLGAIEEAGLEIDAVAGTSMGALVGGAYAMNRSSPAAEATARRFGDPSRIVDRTLPLVAIARSRGVTRLLRELFGETRIEDLPTPFFCVSANLSRARPELHDRGPLWRAVRASSAIPGVFSPILQDGDLLVDGGVMNNFPVDLARSRFGDGPLIASNAYGRERQADDYRFPDEVSGWAMLAERLLPKRRRRIRAPSIMSTLTKATSLNSHYLMERIGQGADLLVRYPTDGVGSLEFDRVDELIATGRRHGAEALWGWLADGATSG